MRALSMALLVAGALGLGEARTGMPGPQGAEGPAGPTCPAPRRLLVKTAAGDLVGPLVDTMAGQGRELRLTVYVESLGRILQFLDPATGRSELIDVHFSTWDCSGTPRSLVSRGGVLIAAGSRLFVSPRTGRSAFPRRSFLDGAGTCHRYPQPISELPGEPLQEVSDPRYPYAAPLVIAYE